MLGTGCLRGCGSEPHVCPGPCATLSIPHLPSSPGRQSQLSNAPLLAPSPTAGPGACPLLDPAARRPRAPGTLAVCVRPVARRLRAGLVAHSSCMAHRACPPSERSEWVEVFLCPPRPCMPRPSRGPGTQDVSGQWPSRWVLPSSWQSVTRVPPSRAPRSPLLMGAPPTTQDCVALQDIAEMTARLLSLSHCSFSGPLPPGAAGLCRGPEASHQRPTPPGSPVSRPLGEQGLQPPSSLLVRASP